MISRVSASGSGAAATARAWPILISPCNSDCRTNSRKIEQSQQVSDVAARLVDELADIVLGMAVPVDQLAIALGLLDRVQILALDILDQRDLRRRRLVDLADDRRDRVQPRPLRRAPAALAGDDLKPVAVGPQQDRLEHPALGDRIGQLVDRFLAELDARLVGIGPDPRDLDLAHAAARARRARRPPERGAASPSSADSPMPRPLAGASRSCRLGQLRKPPDQLAREPDIGLRAGAVADRRSAPEARGSAPPTGARCAARPCRTPRRRGRRGRRRRPPARDCCGGRTWSARRRGSPAAG